MHAYKPVLDPVKIAAKVDTGGTYRRRLITIKMLSNKTIILLIITNNFIVPPPNRKKMSTHQQTSSANCMSDEGVQRRKEQEKKQSWQKTADIVAPILAVSGLILLLGVIVAFAGLMRKFAQGITGNCAPKEVYPGIFIGGKNNVENGGCGLVNKGIVNVLNVTTVPDPEEIRNRYHYLQVPVEDTPSTNISRYFPVTNKFIGSAIESGEPVLVHCHSGGSRATTIIAAYLISIGMTPAYALQQIKLVRPNSYPNPGFRQQLDDYYHSLHPVASAAAAI